MKYGWICGWMFSVVASLAKPVPVPLDGATDGVWRVEYAQAETKTFALATIENPVIGEESYAILGEVRYQGVAGKGFLEMWSHFGDRAFFSRTVEARGPMQALTGDSDWRPFALPFHKGEEPDPDKLVINLVLEGQGTVELRNGRLVAGRGWMEHLHSGAWWGPRMSGILGAIAGTTAGLLGTMIGWGGKNPRRHRLARVCSTLLLVSGVCALVALAAALLTKQPGYVTWMVALFGCLCTGVAVSALRQLRNQRMDVELRQMDAADAAGGPVNI